MKIVLRTPLSPRTGYGKDGFGIARALMERGHDVRLSPSSVTVPLPRDIAGLLTQPLDAPFDLAIHHIEPHEVELFPSDAAAARTSVYWGMWEWKSIEAQDWADTFAQRVQNFNHIVAYDRGTEEAFRPYVDESRLKVVQGGYEPDLWVEPLEESQKSSESPFTFGMLGVLSARKNPYRVIAAFKALREEHGDDFDARLVLKSSVPFFPEAVQLPDRVETILANNWTDQQVKEFYHSLDCLLAPSMGEGKNLPALEAGTCGTPLLLSDISGHRQWASTDLVTWLPTTPQEIAPGLCGGSVSVEDLMEAMWEQYTHRMVYREKGRIAAQVLPGMMNWGKAVERLALTCGLSL